MNNDKKAYPGCISIVSNWFTSGKAGLIFVKSSSTIFIKYFHRDCGELALTLEILLDNKLEALLLMKKDSVGYNIFKRASLIDCV